MAETLTPEQSAQICARLVSLASEVALLNERICAVEREASENAQYLNSVACREMDLDDEVHGRGPCPECRERPIHLRVSSRMPMSPAAPKRSDAPARAAV